MKTLTFPITAKGKNLKQLLLSAVILVVLGAASYFIATTSPSFSDLISKLPAGLFVLTEKDQEPEDEEGVSGVAEESEKKEEKYVERAEKGEGLTHLARRAIKKHLQENLQNFEITPEHKIYAEDYLAKKMGGQWLELGQEIEISAELIKEAIERSAELSSEQLDNLTQYSQLVSF